MLLQRQMQDSGVTMTRPIIELAYMRETIQTGTARELRIGAGLTLAQVAQDIGVDPSTIYRWEHGQHPCGEAAVRYARLLLDLECLEGDLKR